MSHGLAVFSYRQNSIIFFYSSKEPRERAFFVALFAEVEMSAHAGLGKRKKRKKEGARRKETCYFPLPLL